MWKCSFQRFTVSTFQTRAATRNYHGGGGGSRKGEALPVLLNVGYIIDRGYWLLLGRRFECFILGYDRAFSHIYGHVKIRQTFILVNCLCDLVLYVDIVKIYRCDRIINYGYFIKIFLYHTVFQAWKFKSTCMHVCLGSKVYCIKN